MPSHADRVDATLIELISLAGEGVTLDAALRLIVDRVALAVPIGDGAVLTLIEAGRAATVVATSPFVREADALQYDLGEGPCLTAVAEHRLVMSGSPGGDLGWPRFGARVARLGLHSVLAVPMAVRGAVFGSLSIYARAPAAFGPGDVQSARRYTSSAAAIARNAQVLSRCQDEIGQLTQALQVRPGIDQAIGIIRGRTGVSDAEAFLRLRRMSNTESVPLSTVARRLVDDAVRRANARRRDAAS